MKGSYFLVISNNKEQSLKIGKIKYFEFYIGYYIYIGSAMGTGSKSLEYRLKRYFKTAFEKYQEHLHWHIDYLLINQNVKLESIFILPNSVQKEECILSQIIQRFSDGGIPKFGI